MTETRIEPGAAAGMGAAGPEEEARLPLSVIILTYNEEKNVEACLQSVARLAGEIFVVDSGSSDATLSIVRRYTDRVAQHPFETYARQRNWAQDNLPLSYPWVLHLDADERVTPELARSIRDFFRGGAAERFRGAMFSRRTVFLGRWIRHGGHYPVYHVRLFRLSDGRCEDRRYDQHFVVAPPLARLSGDVVDIVASDLDAFSYRHVRWAGEEAKELLRER
ncbi:MAG: glycosyltransferase family 2 protein, partial [Chloroflexi bacterium]|nr:glycosyltransferase family 2 protein [Chloroflexota bacterium]